MSANEKQVGGDHYKSTIQHWDYVIANDLDYFQAQITKYVARWRKKGGLADLNKAKHFLEKYIEVETKKSYEAFPSIKAISLIDEFSSRTMPPKVQKLEDRLPDLTGQKNPRGYDPNEEQF